MRVTLLLLLFSTVLVTQGVSQSESSYSDSLNIAFLLSLGKPKSSEDQTKKMDNFKLSEVLLNSINQEFSLSLQVDRSQEIRIEVVDASGKVLDFLHEGVAVSNLFNDFTFKWQPPTSGNYSVRILGEDFDVSKGFLIQ